MTGLLLTYASSRNRLVFREADIHRMGIFIERNRRVAEPSAVRVNPGTCLERSVPVLPHT